MKQKIHLFLPFLLSLTLSISSNAWQVCAQSTSSNQQRDAAIALYQQEKYSLAIVELKKVVGRQKDDADAWHFLGMAYTRSSKHNEAKQAFEKVVQLRPNSDSALPPEV